MHKVQRMTQSPIHCFYCRRSNIPDDPDTLDDFWALDFERDFNWGDSTYLCKYCCEKVAAISGFVTSGQLEEQLNIQAHLRRRIHDLEAKLELRQRRLDAIAEGSRAIKRVRKEATRGKPAVAKKKPTTEKAA